MACKALFVLLISLAVVHFLPGFADAQGLSVGFYSYTCPNAEAIVFDEISRVIKLAPSLAGPLLRMHFHDCFVRGCDASVLLNSTYGNTAEKDAKPNKSLRGFGVIDRVKDKLEKACPGIVSCADVLALVARDVVFLSKGPFWPVPTGRRDGTVSIDSEASQLPRPDSSISQLIQAFADKGLSVQDLVVLSGPHTLGISHCSSFSSRLSSYDPTMDSKYAAKLRMTCQPNDVTTFVEMDPGSFTTFDTGYYRQVSKRRGLFNSDAALMEDPQTRAYVQSHAAGPYDSEFFKNFGDSMVNMGNIAVLTGAAGEIRKKCSVVN